MAAAAVGAVVSGERRAATGDEARSDVVDVVVLVPRVIVAERPPVDALRYAAVTSVGVDVPLSAVPWLSVDTFLWTR